MHPLTEYLAAYGRAALRTIRRGFGRVMDHRASVAALSEGDILHRQATLKTAP